MILIDMLFRYIIIAIAFYIYPDNVGDGGMFDGFTNLVTGSSQ